MVYKLEDISSTEDFYSFLARTLQAKKNLIQANNTEWEEKHQQTLDELLMFLPSGSGFDSGIQLDEKRSTIHKLVFTTAFHHMDNGYYDGWTEHTITIQQTFMGLDIKVSGRNRNDIKEYIGEMFSDLNI
jgi:hypothetical protein